ncbi:MAG: hypothetical protein ABIK96_14115 [bacterium]
MTTPAVNGGLRVTVGGDVVFDSSTGWTLFELVWGLVEIDLGQTNHIGETDVDAAAWGGIRSLFR